MELRISPNPVDYAEAVAEMETRVAAIRAGTQPELLWLLEHPPLYTAGTSAHAEDLIEARFPVHASGRGGQYTYHGPGQRVAYAMLDLKARMDGAPDIRRFVWLLEEWIIRTLGHFDIAGERRKGRVGIWVVTERGEEKIAALGIRVRHWVSYHGIAINLNPDLSHFSGIVPCGLAQFGVTSIAALGKSVTMAELDAALMAEFERLDFRPSSPDLFG